MLMKELMEMVSEQGKKEFAKLKAALMDHNGPLGGMEPDRESDTVIRWGSKGDEIIVAITLENNSMIEMYCKYMPQDDYSVEWAGRGRDYQEVIKAMKADLKKETKDEEFVSDAETVQDFLKMKDKA